MKRGDLVTVALQGDQGKPRPALVIQSDLFDRLASVTILPITRTLREVPLLHISVKPNVQNGLARPSQVMVDKPQTPATNRLGPVIGHLDAATMVSVSRALTVFLGLA